MVVRKIIFKPVRNVGVSGGYAVLKVQGVTGKACVGTCGVKKFDKRVRNSPVVRVSRRVDLVYDDGGRVGDCG